MTKNTEHAGFGDVVDNYDGKFFILVKGKGKGKGKGNLFYVKNTGSGCPSLPSQGLMIKVFDIHAKKKI